MKIKYTLLTLLALIIVGCSEADPMKKYYMQDCAADGGTTPLCSCLFDYGKENMSDVEFMSSDFTADYRQKNNIPIPGYEDEFIIVDPDPDCGMCEMGPNPDYQEPADYNKMANITFNAMDACYN